MLSCYEVVIFCTANTGSVNSSVLDIADVGSLPPDASADVCVPVPPKEFLAVAKAVVVVQLVPFQDSVAAVKVSPPNVKAAVFAVAFIPEFVPKDFSLGWGIFIFGCLWPIVSTSWYLILIWSVDKSAIFIQKPLVRRILTAISAIGIAGLAIGLAVSSK